MVALCQNGWPAGLDNCARRRIPGTSRYVVLDDGPAGYLLCDIGAWWHRMIEPVDTGTLDDWGAAYRTIRGDEDDLSNHAGGYALDINALLHRLGADPSRSFSTLELQLLKLRISLYRGALRAGAFYTGRKDGMHVETVGSRTLVTEVYRDIKANRLLGGARMPRLGAWPLPATHKVGLNEGNRPTWHDGRVKGSVGRSAVVHLQQAMGLPAGGVFGGLTSKALEQRQRLLRIPATGSCDRTTWNALREAA